VAVELRRPSGAPSLVQEEVPGDGEEVRPHGRELQAASGAPEPDERLGDEVVGEGRITGEEEREPMDVGRVGLVQALEVDDAPAELEVIRRRRLGEPVRGSRGA